MIMRLSVVPVGQVWRAGRVWRVERPAGPEMWVNPNSRSHRKSDLPDLPDLPDLLDLPGLPGHGFIDLIEQRHRRQAARGARFGLAAVADRAGEFDVLSIERSGAV